MSGITLDSPVAAVLGSRSTKDKKKADALAKGLGVRTVGELLRHFPRTYLKTGELTEVASLQEGQPLTVVGEVLRSRVVAGRQAHRVEAVLATDGPPLKLTVFARQHRIAEWHHRRLHEGATGVFTGKVGRFRDEWQLTNPQMVLFGESEDTQEESAREMLANLKALFPIYRVTGPVETWDIQRVVSFALTVVDELPDLLPADLREKYGVVDVHTALRWIHAPDDWGQVGAARKRFRFEEALTTQLVLVRRRAALRSQGARSRSGGGGLLAAFDARLPFELTAGQQEVGRQLEEDLAAPHPMNRLLQGEVGSGKTLVALRAMLRVIDSGGQAALLAPTEVLAQQHHRSITAMLGDLAAGGMLGGADEGTTVALLTGSMTTQQRRESLLRIASGEAGIVIGTHALLEERVSFADLGLVVVDEQHRFGVEQRAALTDKAEASPHVLVMTATPIPRTVAMTVFGDLEVSTLRELPAGRAPIQTNVVPLKDQPRWRDRVWERVREEVEKGHQVYVVCPRIVGDDVEEGEVDEQDLTEDGTPLPAVREGALAAVEDVAPELADGPLEGPAGRDAARPDGPGRQGPDHAGLRPRRRRRAGLHDRHRGRRRRGQRHHDRAARRRPLRHLPAPPAPRPGRPRRAARAVPAGQPCRPRQPRHGAAAGGGRHDGRLRALPHRSRAAPRGRRTRREPVRPALQPGQPAGAPRRGDHRRGPPGGDRDGRRGPRPGALAAARRRGGRMGAGPQE